jgi:hypothetical protein
MKKHSKLKKSQESNKEQVRSEKKKLTVQIPENIIDRIKNAVYWTPGLTLSEFAADAFVRAIDLLEDENEGRFLARGTQELRAGRPLK